MSKYRAGVIGLGWMGLLYDLAGRLPYRLGIDTADSIDKPTPELDVHRRSISTSNTCQRVPRPPIPRPSTTGPRSIS